MSGTKEGSRASKCSFCGKEEARSNLVIAGYGRAFVCHPCIRVLGEAIEIEPVEVSDREDSPVRSVPRDICATLEKYVIGQQKAKKTLSVAVYNHFKRIDMDPYGYVRGGHSPKSMDSEEFRFPGILAPALRN